MTLPLLPLEEPLFPDDDLLFDLLPPLLLLLVEPELLDFPAELDEPELADFALRLLPWPDALVLLPDLVERDDEGLAELFAPPLDADALPEVLRPLAGVISSSPSSSAHRFTFFSAILFRRSSVFFYSFNVRSSRRACFGKPRVSAKVRAAP